MAIQVQLRRGSTAQNNSFTGAIGEVTVDTDVDTLRVHDGATAGGATVVTVAATQTLSNKTLSAFTLTGNITGNANISGFANVVGNVSASYFLGNGSQLTGLDATTIQNGTANVRTFLNANVVISAAGTPNVAIITATGAAISGTLSVSNAITVNSLNAATAIVNGGTNAVGNIGSSSSYFNTVFAKSTSALYADLAEMYQADAEYAPGTVLSFGGTHDVTMSLIDLDTRVAGVVSTDPAYVMDSGMSAEFPVAVALMGKVPTQVTGPVRKGDLMVSAGDGTARCDLDPPVGSVLGKSLEDFDGVRGVINIVVGRL